MNKPLITVITITYNAARELPDTLISLHAQDFHDFEHLIIDGASKDNTLQVARELGLPEARIISEPDRGLYDAMNKGLHNARGKYVLFLNAGDSLHSADTLRRYARAAEAHDADIVYADTLIVDSLHQIKGPRHLSAPEVLTVESFSHGMLVCHQAFMVKRSIAPDYDTNYRFSADYDWCIRCMKRTTPDRCINLHTVAIDYLADGLTDKNHRKSLAERFRVMCNHYGAPKAVWRHASFIPRALMRKFKT